MDETATSIWPPTQLGGRYEVHAELGRGGMARVYRATDTTLRRDVALKILHPHLARNPEVVERFQREALSHSRVSHPNIVSVYDAAAPRRGREGDEPTYMVLQLIDGPSLRDVLTARRRLSPAEALAVLGPVAAGLGAVHAAGLVHRDVKPENVLLTHDGEVAVSDFGLARVVAASTHTFGGDVIVGSPHYLSPEAVSAQPLDARSDVYSLGVLAYECLTGRPPYEADSPLATALQHASRRVPAPSETVPGLPAALDDLVARATEPQPDDRFADAGAFRDALVAAVPGGPTALQAGTSRDTVVIPVDDADTLVARLTRSADPDASSQADDRSAVPPVFAQPNGTVSVPATPGGPHVAERAGHTEGTETTATTEEADDPEDTGDHDAGVRRRPRWRRVVLLTLLGLVLAGVAAFGVWDRVIAPVTAIPEVTERPAGAARAALTDAGFVVTIADERINDLEVTEGHVLDQDPRGEARRGAAVTLTISAGPRQVTIPSLTDTRRDRAVAELEDLPVEVDIRRAHSETIRKGRVVGSDPSSGAVVDETSEVTLTISDGPRPIEVPGVEGEAEASALADLRDAGFEARVVERRYDEQVPAGAVVTQAPTAGDTGVRGDVVELVVSRGTEPFEMPAVRGEDSGDARERLEGLGLEVDVRERGGVAAFLNPGRVYDQDPAPETQVRRGDTVTLYAYER